MAKMVNKRTCLVVMLVVLTGLWGCAAKNAFKTANKMADIKDWDRAVIEYSRAVALDPGNTNYQIALRRAKQNAAQEHLKKAKEYRNAGQIDLALIEYRQTINLDPLNQVAENEFKKLLKQIEEKADLTAKSFNLSEMKRKAQEEKPVPLLDPQADIPIKIKFDERDSEEIFRAIAKPAGINVLFDEQFRSSKISVDLADVTFLKAMDILNLQTKTFYKVIDEHTIIIIPDNRQKRQEYEDQVIRTFYLSNADVKEVFQNLRTLIDTRKIAMSEQLNAITIRDTPDKVAVAGKIIESNDKAKGEVVIDVELLEINWSKTREMGPDLGDSYVITQQLDTGSGDNSTSSIPLNNLSLLEKESSWILGIPSITYRFLKETSNAKTIAKPQLRVTEGEKASIHIGDQVPIRTATYNTGQVNNNVITSSFQYHNVGIQIEIEPRVHHNEEVTLKLKVEISSITSEGDQPTIGTRNIETVIRLQNGQINLLAGLIKEDERDSLKGPLGLSDIPIVKKLFSSTKRQKLKTDIVLSLTPHIIRMPNITEEDLKPLWVGTEEHIKLQTKQEPPKLTGGPVEEEEGFHSEGVTQMEEKREETPPVKEEKEETPPAAEPDLPPVTGPAAREQKKSGPEASERKQTPQTGMTLNPPARTSQKGETFTMDVRITDAEDINKIRLNLTYDPSVAALESVDTGEFLASKEKNLSFLRDINNENGSAALSIARTDGEGRSGSGNVLTLVFRALEKGSTPIGLNGSNVSSADNESRNVILLGGKVAVQ